jgi:molecular chaperone GrpE
VGNKNDNETDKQQLTVEETEDLQQETLETENSDLSEENPMAPEGEIESGESAEADADPEPGAGSLWGDAFEAAQVIEDIKKEKPGMKEKIINAFKRPDDKPEPKAEPHPSDGRLRDDLEAKDLQLKRLAADFDNFRRRQAQEREDLIRFAGEKLILDILPVLDNFERAMASAKDAKEIASVVSGVELIQKQLLEAFIRNGVEEIEALGNAFDPNYHEAVQQMVDDEKPDHTVINELQKGYTLNGRVIRPSMVIVSTTSE